MSEQKKAAKIEESAILSAIEQVRAKGFDINPYTVSDEARVFPSDIFRTPELMKIILDARQESERWHFQPSKGETDIKFSTFEMDITKLKEENERLAAQVNELEDKLTSPDSTDQAPAPDNTKDKKAARDSEVDFSLAEDFNEQFKDLLAMESESEVQELEKQLAESRQECARIEEETARAQEEAQRSREEINKVQAELNDARNELTRSQDELARAQNELVFAKENSAQVQAQADTSQSDEELARTQEELVRMQEEMAKIEDDNRDLSHSVLGLEKVNEALNIRLRELENLNRELKEAQPKETEPKTENQNAAPDPELTAYVAELELRISEMAGKQAEMQEEMDVLVTQLQNSWHTGYQKGLTAGKTQAMEEAAAQAAQSVQVEPASVNYDMNSQQPFEAPDLDMLQNPGISSSEYDTLKDLKWKDVETVYQMGGQAAEQQEAYYPEQDAQPNYAEEETQAGYEFGGNYQNYDEQENIMQDPYATYNQGDYAQGEYANDMGEMQGGMTSDSYNQDQIQSYDAQPGYLPESPVAESTEIVDFDQMDIFEDIEELERLGRIELPDDIIPLDHSGGKANQDELRELVQHKIQHAAEHVTGEVPRMVGKGGAEAPVDASKGAINKFVGQRGAHASSEAAQSSTNLTPVVRSVPPEVRKACQILGMAPETLTKDTINDAWKKAITAPGVHPDHGGDTEIATSINLAKQTLLKFLEQTAPKLGKKFGPQSNNPTSRFTGKKKPDEQE